MYRDIHVAFPVIDRVISEGQDLRSSKSFATNYTNCHEFFKQFAYIREICGLLLGFCVSPEVIFQDSLVTVLLF